MTDTNGFEGPAIVELMGHRRLAGYVSEAEMFGAKLLRVDVPQPDGKMATQLYGGGAIYCLTPTTDEMVQRIATSARNSVRPVQAWELPAAEDRPERDPGLFEDEPFDEEDDDDPPY